MSVVPRRMLVGRVLAVGCRCGWTASVAGSAPIEGADLGEGLVEDGEAFLRLVRAHDARRHHMQAVEVDERQGARATHAEVSAAIAGLLPP